MKILFLTLATKHLNPFSLDIKLADKNEHKMIYMLWKECMPQKFYRRIVFETKKEICI